MMSSLIYKLYNFKAKYPDELPKSKVKKEKKKKSNDGVKGDDTSAKEEDEEEKLRKIK